MATSGSTIDFVESFYVSLEELRSTIAGNQNRSKGVWGSEEQVHLKIPRIEKLSKSLLGATLDLVLDEGSSSNNNEAHQLIVSDCCLKASQVALECVRWICTGSPSVSISSSSSTQNNASSSSSVIVYELPDGGPTTQAAIAHVVECALGIIASNDSAKKNNNSHMPKAIHEIQQLYSTYQKNLLRQRCKPSVANIVNVRSVAQSQSLTVHQLLLQYSAQIASISDIDYDDDDNDPKLEKKQQRQATLQPHMYAITTILTEATHLIHPLGCWYNAIPPENRTIPDNALLLMCQNAIFVLDQEVQTLCSRIGTWFIQDREVTDRWMKQITLTLSSSSQQQTLLDIQFLDTILLEELSYVCQLISRYCEFIFQYGPFDAEKLPLESSVVSHPLSLMAQEYIGYYSTLEDYLYNANLQRAVTIAKPVEINDGIFVSSLVEDAFYLSKKTLERARSTKNDQALLTITNRICESWKDVIFDAIATGTGCTSYAHQPSQTGGKASVENKDAALPSNKNSGEVMNSFTAAFLDALDEEMGPPKPILADTTTESKLLHQSPPPSMGGMISDDAGNAADWQVNTCICSLNSTASASSACLAISFFYEEIMYEFCDDDDITGNDNNGEIRGVPHSLGQNSIAKLLDFTREEWLAHSKQYSSLLTTKASDAVQFWCGAPLDWASSNIFKNQASSGNSLITKMLNIEKSLFPLQRVQKAFAMQSYNIVDAETYHKFEADTILISQLLDPLHTCDLISQIILKRCDQAVIMEIVRHLARIISHEIILPMIFSGVGPQKAQKNFTDWGALLLAKQVRVIQNELCSLLHYGYENNFGNTAVSVPTSNQNHHSSALLPSTTPVLALMERVNQVVAVLQLEKPSDWISLKYSAPAGIKSAQLTKEEIRQVMMLRIGFSKEAIASLYDAL